METCNGYDKLSCAIDQYVAADGNCTLCEADFYCDGAGRFDCSLQETKDKYNLEQCFYGAIKLCKADFILEGFTKRTCARCENDSTDFYKQCNGNAYFICTHINSLELGMSARDRSTDLFPYCTQCPHQCNGSHLVKCETGKKVATGLKQ